MKETTVKEVKPKRKMRPGGGKSKGSGFEGLIAKKLSAALPLNFIRSPGSGARVGGKNFEKIGAMFGADALKIFNADVVPVNEREQNVQFNFSIECKFYATQDHFTSMFSGTSNVFKWFDEAIVDAAKVERQPILIWKWNHTPTFVAVHAGYSKLVKPTMTIVREGKHSLDVYELEGLLKHPEFWVTAA